MQKVIAALRANGGKDVTTQTVSLSTAFDQNGQPNGFVASNVASAETTLDDAGALIDAAVAAGANTVYGPSLSRSDADALYRQALAKAVDDAKARAEILAKAAGRSLGRVTAIAESGSAPVPVRREGRRRRRTRLPSSPAPQETTRVGERHLRAALSSPPSGDPRRGSPPGRSLKRPASRPAVRVRPAGLDACPPAVRPVPTGPRTPESDRQPVAAREGPRRGGALGRGDDV